MKRTIVFIVILVIIVAVGAYLYFYNQSQSQSGTISPNVEQAQPEETKIEEVSYIDVTPAEAQALIEDNPDLVILDVSSAYDQGHLPGAINYYVGDGSLEEAIPTLDKDVPYLVYCHVELASKQGAQMLIDADFDMVYRLAGEYSGWIAAGYDIEE